MSLLATTLGGIIRESVRWALANGYRIRRGNWGVYYQFGIGWGVNSEGAICPLGAVLLQHQPILDLNLEIYQYENALAGLLNCSPAWLDDFTEGVDNGPGLSGGSQVGHQMALELIDGIKP